MIVTTAAFGSHQLTLIASVNEHSSPKLVEVNWLLAGNSWHSSKSIPKLKKHYGLVDQNFTFINNDSLSESEPAQALLDIGYGETISYATLAQNVDNPKGFRAVANANSKNPFSIIVPCHRVIASDGKLGGYTGGLDKKEYLLGLEGVTCKT